MSNDADLSGPSAEDRLVIGIGQDGRGDDVAGREAVRRLAARHVAPCVLSDGEPGRLLELFARAPRIWVVDAVRSGAPPGTLHRYEGPGLPLNRGPGPASTHGLSLGEAIDIAVALDRQPARLVVHGIEAGPVTLGEGLSSAVARAVPRLVARLRDELAAAGDALAARGAGPRA